MKFTWKDTNLLLWKIRVSTEQKKNWFTQPRFWTWETNLGETAKRVLIHLWLFHARRTFTTLWNKSKLSIWKWVKWQRHVFTYHTQTFDCFWSIQLCSWVANRNPLIGILLDWKQNCSFIHFFFEKSLFNCTIFKSSSALRKHSKVFGPTKNCFWTKMQNANDRFIFFWSNTLFQSIFQFSTWKKCSNFVHLYLYSLFSHNNFKVNTFQFFWFLLVQRYFAHK